MISISLDTQGLSNAAGGFSGRVDGYLRAGLEMTLESIAARAKETTTFVDRTGALRNSIQSDGVEGAWGSSEGLVGTVSFAATSERRTRRKRGGSRRRPSGGFFYGLVQEYGSAHIHEKRFIRDAIDAEGGQYLEDAVRRAFEEVGFEVRG